MDDLSRVFPYDKLLMLNVLYNTLGTLGFEIEKANSEEGILQFVAVSTLEPSRRVHIACGDLPKANSAVVQIRFEPAEDAGKRFVEVIFDEISATLKRSFSSKENESTTWTSKDKEESL